MEKCCILRYMAQLYQGLIEYFKGSQQELKRVIWPSWQITLRYTLIVIVISVGVALILGAFDFAFDYFLRLLIFRKS